MSQPDPAARNTQPSARVARVGALVVVIILGLFLVSWFSWARAEYWLLKDAQEGMAIVTKDLWTGHNSVGYRYTVNHKEYTGKGMRNYQDLRYRNVHPGNKSVVYYSASHPWMSSLRRPDRIGEGLPVVLFVLLFETMAVITLINPRHKWAFHIHGGNQSSGTSPISDHCGGKAHDGKCGQSF